MNSDTRHVVIVGGGIAGLTTAYELQERARAEALPLRWTLVEQSQRVGGKIVTDQEDGFVIEGGPDSFLTQKPWAADLCRRLGLNDELIGTNDAQRGVYVLNHGRLVRLPEGLNLIVPTRLRPFLASPLISWSGKLRMALDLLIPARPGDDDESLASFVGRRFGREAVEKLAEPLMSGIHAGDPARQSLLGTFARFRDLELTYGSLIWGTLAQRKAAPPVAGPARPASAFLTLRGGLQRLVDALRAALDSGQIMTGTQVAAVRRGVTSSYQVALEDGTTLDADAVVLATPAYATAAMVAELAPSLADELRQIRYVSTATVTLGFKRADVPHPLDTFGFLVPRGERRQVFGSTWSSIKFDGRAPTDGALIRCFVGGYGQEELVALPDDELIALARRELRSIMGIAAEPLVTRVFRWHKGNPQYDVGHRERIRSIYARCAALPGLSLTGGVYEGVGLPDCIRHAQATAERLLAELTEADHLVASAG